MRAYYELRQYSDGGRVWLGEYENLHNLSHWHYDCELIYVKRGHADVFVNKEKYSVHVGQTLFIGSGEVHRIEADENSLLVLLLFDDAIADELFVNRTLKCPLLRGEYGVYETIERIALELKQRKPFYNKAAETFIGGMLIEIVREEELSDRKKENTYAERYKHLLSEIEDKYVWYTFDDAASFMGISSHYFSELFHKMSGITFSAYLNTVKIRNAIVMLKARCAKSITEISYECGFNSIRHFNRVFKEITGYSPKELPQDYDLVSLPIKDIKHSPDPTLEGSRLVVDE